MWCFRHADHCGVCDVRHSALDRRTSQIANGIAVVCSATYNFVMNRNVTFKSSSNFTRSVALFVLLWIWNFTFSTLLIGWMPGATGLSPYVVKFIAMACQFGWGYPLCKYVIFR